MSEAQPEHLQSLPSGWCWASIGQCRELLQYGSSAKASDDARGVPVLRMGNIRNDGRLNIDRLKYLPAGHKEFPELLLRSGDLLFNRTNSAELVGKTAVYRGVPSPCSFASYLIRVRLHACVLPTLVSASLNSAHGRRWIRSVLNQTVGQANVNGTKLAAFRFELPPLKEQERLVDALDELFSNLDAGVAALERVRQKLKLYRASVLKAAVEGALTAEWRMQHPNVEPATELLRRILTERSRRWEEDQLAKFKAKGQEPPKNWKAKYKEPVAPDTTNLPPLPEGWCWATVDQLIATPIINGVSVRGSDQPPGIAALRLSAMSDNGFDYSERRYLPLQPEDVADLAIKSCDFFVSRGNGSKHLVGRGTLAQEPPDTVIFPDTMMRLRLVSGYLAPHWVPSIWRSGAVRQQIERVAKTTAGIWKIAQPDLAAITVPLPAVAEQEAVVEVVEDQLSVVDHLEADIDAKLKSARLLRQAILRHAFSGKLVPQDPNDEPASELLKRIAAGREARAREAAAVTRGSQPAATRRPVARRA